MQTNFKPKQLEDARTAEVEKILRDMGGLFGTAPSGTMAFASFMAKQNELKSPPAKWQDAFYPPVSEGKGS